MTNINHVTNNKPTHWVIEPQLESTSLQTKPLGKYME